MDEPQEGRATTENGGHTRRQLLRAWGSGAAAAVVLGGPAALSANGAPASEASYFFAARVDDRGKLILLPDIADAGGRPNAAAGGRTVTLRFPPDVTFVGPGETPGGRRLLLEPGATVVGYGNYDGTTLEITELSLEPPA